MKIIRDFHDFGAGHGAETQLFVGNRAKLSRDQRQKNGQKQRIFPYASVSAGADQQRDKPDDRDVGENDSTDAVYLMECEGKKAVIAQV